jgi:hypothetical protein
MSATPAVFAGKPASTASWASLLPRYCLPAASALQSSPCQFNAMNDDDYLFGLSFTEFEDIALQVGLTGLILFMLFIIWNLGKESKAGRYGMMWMFLGLGIGFVGFVAKGIIQKLLGIE